MRQFFHLTTAPSPELPAGTEPLRFDVVIAGGGFAGMYCAQRLGRLWGKDAVNRVALIAEQNYMVFQPLLPEVCGSEVAPRHAVNPLRRLCRKVTVLRGRITSIDLEKKCLDIDAGVFTSNVPLCFEHLILSVGSVVDLSRVPGMPEHAFILKNVADALELRGTIIDRFEEAALVSDPVAMRRLLTFVIVGGGYSGVETAGQVMDLVQDVSFLYPRIRPQDIRVVLVHSGAHLLPEIGERLGRYAERELQKNGVEVLLNSRVNAMTSSKVFLQDGRVIETHTVVSTVGNAPNPLITRLCEQNGIATDKGRIVTEPTMQVPGFPNLWAAGDCALVPLPNGKPSPPTAQFAMRQGKLLGENLEARTVGHQPKPFTFTGLGELATVGRRAAVADILGFQFSGFVAWWLWRTIYLAKLPGLERKVRVMIDWTLDLFFPRDISLLNARTSEVLQEMHLEPGDALFHPGEPAFSFYILKKGEIEIRDAEGGVFRTIHEGEYFGERALLNNHTWRYCAVATKPTRIVALAAEVFDQLKACKAFNELFEQSVAKITDAEEHAGKTEDWAVRAAGR